MILEAINYAEDIAALKGLPTTGMVAQTKYISGDSGYEFWPNANMATTDSQFPSDDGGGYWRKKDNHIRVAGRMVEAVTTGTGITTYEVYEKAFTARMYDYSCFYDCVKANCIGTWNDQSDYAKAEMEKMLLVPDNHEWSAALDTVEKREAQYVVKAPDDLKALSARLKAFRATLGAMVKSNPQKITRAHAKAVWDRCQELKDLEGMFANTLTQEIVDFFNDDGDYSSTGYTSTLTGTHVGVVDAANDILRDGKYKVNKFLN